MAEWLKQTYDLLVLKVELGKAAAGAGGLAMRWTLQGKEQGQLQNLHEWQIEDAFAPALSLLRGQVRGNPDITLPPGLGEQLRDAIHHFNAEPRPLWVHLVKPYGALRLVPWEQLLVPLLQVPVLMLPDFIFPPPREALSTLDVAVCASAPLGCEDHEVRRALNSVVGALRDGSPRSTRVHVFCDADMVAEQRARWPDPGTNVRVHDPQDAAPFAAADVGSRLVDRAGLLRSPWLMWMRQALADRAIDVVHFCGHGLLTRGRGALLFAQSPLARTETYLAGPVGAQELITFLNQVGAWSTAFTATADNHAPAGLRALADEIAQARPGPLLMHDGRLDPSGSQLADALRFLYAAQPVPPPCSPALFLYCQPYLVGQHETAGAAFLGPDQPSLTRNAMQAEVIDAASVPSALDDVLTHAEQLPPWVAATRNFVDAQQLRLQAMARDSTLPEPMLREQADLVQETLQRLSQSVANLALERGVGGALMSGASLQAGGAEAGSNP